MTHKNKIMKKKFAFLAGGCLITLSMIGCQGTKPMDPAIMQAKIDSLYTVSAATLTDSVNNACQAQSAMVVKMMSDSICKANGLVIK